MDGPWPTAFAAQPLASHGIVVLQVPDNSDWNLLMTEREAPNQSAVYDAAVDYLYGRGIIDRNSIGIIGFSRTCYYVKYALTHSDHHFAAAVVADGVDMGYFQYLAFGAADSEIESEVASINGGFPIGHNLFTWQQRAPGFRLDKVTTPVLAQALGPNSVVGEWEWFSGLSMLGKPVDLLYLPYGSHVLVKPQERKASLQSSVDWLCFWLKGEQEIDPNKRSQYFHWRQLRKLQERKGIAQGVD